MNKVCPTHVPPYTPYVITGTTGAIVLRCLIQSVFQVQLSLCLFAPLEQFEIPVKTKKHAYCKDCYGLPLWFRGLWFSIGS